MRSLLLSAVLAIASLGLTVAAPSEAQARWPRWGGYSGSYYNPGYSSYYYTPSYGSYYYPGYSSYYYSTPSYGTYYTPGYSNYYYSAPTYYWP